MKKTILATAVGVFSMVGVAQATPAYSTDQHVPEVYGQVGASYDHVKGGKNEMNYLRNSEIGVRGGVNAADIMATYDIRVKGEEGFDGSDKAEFDKVELGLSQGAFALHAGKIESRYDLATRKMDTFGNQFRDVRIADGVTTNAFQAFDHVGTSNGLALSADVFEGVGLFVEVSEGDHLEADLGDVYTLGGSFSAHGLDFTVAYSDTDADDAKHNETKFGLGYDFSEIGGEGLYLGAIHEYSKESIVGGFDIDEKSKTTGFSGSYKMTDAATLHLGYAFSKTKDKADSSKVVADDRLARVGINYAMTENLSFDLAYGELKDKLVDEKDKFTTLGATYRF